MAIFSSCIRAIRTAELSFSQKDESVLKKFTIDTAAFLLRSAPSLQTVFYFAAESLYPKELEKIRPLTVEKIISLFTPGEVTSIIGLTYFYRRLQKRCDEEELQRITEKMVVHMRVGAIVGDTFNQLGSGYGMLCCGMRYIAQAVLLEVDPDGFAKVRRKIQIRKKLFDLALEEEQWSCNHLQIASLLVQSLGYGLGISIGLTGQYERVDADPPSDSHPEVVGQIASVQGALIWSESLHGDGAAPAGLDEASELYLPEEAQNEIVAQIQAILSTPEKLQWILKRVADLPPTVREELGIRQSTKSTDSIDDSRAETTSDDSSTE